MDQLITDPEFMEKVERKIRPSLEFNTNSSITRDFGATDYIKSLEVELYTEPSDSVYPQRIIITPYAHLDSAPIIEFLDDIYFTEVNVSRGKGHVWIYEYGGVTYGDRSREPGDWIRLRLEILN